MKFKINGIPKEDLEELMKELRYFGVSEFTIEESGDGLILCVKDDEWKNSWKSVGLTRIPDDIDKHAEVFQEELNGIKEPHWNEVIVEALKQK